METVNIPGSGFDPRLSDLSPFRGTQYALIEAIARTCAIGGDWRQIRFSLQEYFGRTSRSPEAWESAFRSLPGATARMTDGAGKYIVPPS